VKTVLFLGRIHPVKGLDLLLDAWATVMDRFPDWRLLVVGTDSAYGVQGGYLRKLKVLTQNLKLKRIEFFEPAYGNAKLSVYREANLFVLPTCSENFGITVAEALAAGTPAIVTKGAPWQGLEMNRSGWWIDFGVGALVGALAEAMAESPDALAERGLNGREWMIREFSWCILGQKMHQTYQWLIMGGERPAWVRVN
jgi:glycosyltransferase involved in cell wall biosynthesis